ANTLSWRSVACFNERSVRRRGAQAATDLLHGRRQGVAGIGVQQVRMVGLDVGLHAVLVAGRRAELAVRAAVPVPLEAELAEGAVVGAELGFGGGVVALRLAAVRHRGPPGDRLRRAHS